MKLKITSCVFFNKNPTFGIIYPSWLTFCVVSNLACVRATDLFLQLHFIINYCPVVGSCIVKIPVKILAALCPAMCPLVTLVSALVVYFQIVPELWLLVGPASGLLIKDITKPLNSVLMELIFFPFFLAKADKLFLFFYRGWVMFYVQWDKKKSVLN